MDNIENELMLEKKVPKVKKAMTDEDIIQLTVIFKLIQYEMNGFPHNLHK